MQGTTYTVRLRYVLAMVHSGKWLIAAVATLAVFASLAVSAAMERQYEASAVVRTNDQAADVQTLGLPDQSSFRPDAVAAARGARVTSPSVLARVRRLTHTSLSTSELKHAVTTSVDPRSNLVTIATTMSSAGLARRLADAFADGLSADARRAAVTRYLSAAAASERRARDLTATRDATLRSTLRNQASSLYALAKLAQPISVVRRAETPTTPVRPRPAVDALLALLMGVSFGLGIALLRAKRDRRLRGPDDVKRYLETPVVGLLTMVGPRDDEVFGILRANVDAMGPDDGSAKLVLVTSPLPQEGKSTVATGLARSQARAGSRTLLIDCDLRRPSVAGRLGLDQGPGLVDYLHGRAASTDVLRVVPAGDGRSPGLAAPKSFSCITAGSTTNKQAELLESERFRNFLKDVRAVYDCVILDSAPLLPVSDTRALLGETDTTLMCVRLNQTTRDEAVATSEAIGHFPAKPMGLVITAAASAPGFPHGRRLHGTVRRRLRRPRVPGWATLRSHAGLAAAVAATALVAALVPPLSPDPVVPVVFLAAVAAVALAFISPLTLVALGLLIAPLDGVLPAHRVSTGVMLLAGAGWLLKWMTSAPLRMPRAPALAAFAAFVVANAAGLLFAPEPLVVLRQVLTFGIMFVVAVAIAHSATPRQVMRIMFAIALCGGIAGLIAIIDPKPLTSHVFEGGDVARATGGLGSPNALGIVLSFALPVQIVLALRGPGVVRLIAAGCAGLAAVGMTLAVSRASFIGLGAAVIVLAFWPPFRRAALLVLPLLLVLALVGNNPATPIGGNVVQRLSEARTSGSNDPRLTIWKTVPTMVADRPVFGMGGLEFLYYAPAYGLIFTGGAPNQAHNLLLTVVSETGLVGLLAFLAMCVTLATALRRVVRRTTGEVNALGHALAAAFIGFFVAGLLDYGLGAAPIAALVFVALGCALALAREADRLRADPAISSAR